MPSYKTFKLRFHYGSYLQVCATALNCTRSLQYLKARASKLTGLVQSHPLCMYSVLAQALLFRPLMASVAKVKKIARTRQANQQSGEVERDETER
jgi:hypothetical protein